VPKKIKRVNKFEKGLINNPDKRDIPEGGLANATNVMVDIPGQVRQMGNEVTSYVLGADNSSLSGALTPGYGTHVLKADHNMVNFNTQAAKMIIVQNNQDFNVIGNGIEYADEIDTGWTGSQINPTFFDFNGTLRVSQGAFNHDDHENYVFTHINKVWFADAVDSADANAGAKKIYAHGNTSGGYGGATSGDWIDVPQRIKRPGDSLLTENDAITSSALPIVPGRPYVDIEWTNAENVGDSGEWPSDTAYKFGISYLYDGIGEVLQESLIHVCANTVNPSGDWGDDNGILGIKMGFVADTGIDIGAAPSYDPRIVGAHLYWCGDSTGDFDDPLLIAKADLIKSIVTTHDGEEALMDYEQVSGTIYRYGNNITTSGHSHLLCSKIPTTTYEAQTTFPSTVETNYARFKTAVISNRRLYAANVQRYKENNIGNITALPAENDRMLVSPANNMDLLPSSDYLDIATQDGDAITALAALGDKILQFKNNTLYIINTSQDYEYVEAEHKFLGVASPYGVMKTEFGIVWVNTNGCYIYDGKEVKNLVDGKISLIKDSTPTLINGESKEMEMPGWSQFITNSQYGQVGYITLTKQLVVFDSPYGTTNHSGDIMVYDFRTQSWTYGKDRVGLASRSNIITDYIDELIYMTFGDHSSGDTVSQYIIAGNSGVAGQNQVWTVGGITTAMVNTDITTSIILEMNNDTPISEPVNIIASEVDSDSNNTMIHKLATAIREKLGASVTVSIIDAGSTLHISYDKYSSDLATYSNETPLQFDTDVGEVPVSAGTVLAHGKHLISSDDNATTRKVYPAISFGEPTGSSESGGVSNGARLRMGLAINSSVVEADPLSYGAISPEVISEMAIQYPNSRLYDTVTNTGRHPMWSSSTAAYEGQMNASWANGEIKPDNIFEHVDLDHDTPEWEYFTTIDGFSLPYDHFHNPSGDYNTPQTSMYGYHPSSDKRFCNPGAIWIKNWLGVPGDGQSDPGTSVFPDENLQTQSLPSSKPTYPNGWYKTPLRTLPINHDYVYNKSHNMNGFGYAFLIGQQETKVDTVSGMGDNVGEDGKPHVSTSAFNSWMVACAADKAYILHPSSGDVSLFTHMMKWAGNVSYMDIEATYILNEGNNIAEQFINEKVYSWDTDPIGMFKRLGVTQSTQATAYSSYASGSIPLTTSTGSSNLGTISGTGPDDAVVKFAISRGGYWGDYYFDIRMENTEPVGSFEFGIDTVISFGIPQITRINPFDGAIHTYEFTTSLAQGNGATTDILTGSSTTGVIPPGNHFLCKLEAVNILEMSFNSLFDPSQYYNHDIGISAILGNKVNANWANNLNYDYPIIEDTTHLSGQTGISLNSVEIEGEIELSCNTVNILPCGSSPIKGIDPELPSTKGDLLIMIVGDYGSDFAAGTHYEFGFGGASYPAFGGVETEYNFPSPAYLSYKKVKTFETTNAAGNEWPVNSVTYLLFKGEDQGSLMQNHFYELATCKKGFGAVGIWLDHEETAFLINQNSSASFQNLAQGIAPAPRIVYARFSRSYYDHSAFYTFTLDHPNHPSDNFNYTATWESGAYKSSLDVASNFQGQLETGLTSQAIHAINYLDNTALYKPRLWTATGRISGGGNNDIFIRTVGADDNYHDSNVDLSLELRIGDTFKISNAPTATKEYIVANVEYGVGVNIITIKTSGEGIPAGNIATEAEFFAEGDGTITSSTIVLQETNVLSSGEGFSIDGKVHTDLMVKGFKNDSIFIQSQEAKEGSILIETPDYILNQESSKSNVNKVYVSLKDESYYNNGRFSMHYATDNNDDWRVLYFKPIAGSVDIPPMPAANIVVGDIWGNPALYFNEDLSSLKNASSIRFRIIGTDFQSFKLNDINILFRDKHIS
jgi:hypothetical protein